MDTQKKPCLKCLLRDLDEEAYMKQLHRYIVQLDPETYVKREVKLGASDGTRVQILEGLSPGETIVSRGVAQVKMASFSGAIPGHTHSH